MSSYYTALTGNECCDEQGGGSPKRVTHIHLCLSTMPGLLRETSPISQQSKHKCHAKRGIKKRAEQESGKKSLSPVASQVERWGLLSSRVAAVAAHIR